MGTYTKDYKYINKYGSAYDLYGATSLRGIFTTENIGNKMRKRKGASPGKMRDNYGCHSNAHLAAKIYLQYLVLATQDAINGDIVRMSTTKEYPTIQVGFLEETESKYNILSIKSDHAMSKINIRDLSYRLPRVLIQYGPYSTYKDRVILVPKKLYLEMIDNIVAGKRYIVNKSVVKKIR